MPLIEKLKENLNMVPEKAKLFFEPERLDRNILIIGNYINTCVYSYTEIHNNYQSTISNPKIDKQLITSLDDGLFNLNTIIGNMCNSLSIRDIDLNNYVNQLLDAKGYNGREDEESLEENLKLFNYFMINNDLPNNFYTYYLNKSRVIPISTDYLNYILVSFLMVNYHVFNSLNHFKAGNIDESQKSLVHGFITIRTIATIVNSPIDEHISLQN